MHNLRKTAQLLSKTPYAFIYAMSLRPEKDKINDQRLISLLVVRLCLTACLIISTLMAFPIFDF